MLLLGTMKGRPVSAPGDCTSTACTKVLACRSPIAHEHERRSADDIRIWQHFSVATCIRASVPLSRHGSAGRNSQCYSHCLIELDGQAMLPPVQSWPERRRCAIGKLTLMPNGLCEPLSIDQDSCRALNAHGVQSEASAN